MDSEKYLADLKDLLITEKNDKLYCEKCVKYANRLLENNLPVIFDTKHLSLLLGINVYDLCKILFCENLFYKDIKIKKKNGNFREISIPCVTLKYIQKWILNHILINIKISEYATGFCKKKSIVDNAKNHVGKECVVNMDIKDFFASISRENIFRMFFYFGYTKEVSYVLSNLCTYKEKLPQGSPASPYLSNISCLRLDKRISLLVQKYEGSYTRYADDITISGKKGIRKCKQIVEKIIIEEGFEVNNSKTRIAYSHEKQEVTGLIVNHEKIRVNKKYKKEFQQELYYCKKFGVKEHMKRIKCDKSFYKEHLYGKAYFVNMVEPNEGSKFFEILNNINWDY